MKKRIFAGIMSVALLAGTAGCEKIQGITQANVTVPTSFRGVYKVTEGTDTYTAVVSRDEDGVWQLSPSEPQELAGMSVRLDNVFGESGLAETRASVYFGGMDMSAKTFESSAAAKVTSAVDRAINAAIINADNSKMKKVKQSDGTYLLSDENMQIILNGDNVVYIRAGDAEFAAVA